MSIIHSKLVNLEGLQKSFLGERLQENPNYGFLPYYLYFLDNCDRWPKSPQIQKRLLTKVSTNCTTAWNEWKQFRSAQAEVTFIYLIENYLLGDIKGLEVSRPGNKSKKSCDIFAQLSGGEFYLEVRAQSGQQHGDRHPLLNNTLFTPQNEEDLSSWLFERPVSSKTGKRMVPHCQQASEKGADALLTMIDIFQWKTTDLRSLGQYLVPDYTSIEESVFAQTSRDSEFKPFPSSSLQVSIIVAGKQTTEKMGSLGEIWLFDESYPDKLLVIRAAEATAVLC